jgi:MFS family permease
MGIYIGSGIAFIVGGIVAGIASAQETWELPIVGATRPWQVVFFIVGLPGIVLSLLMFTVREPVRRGMKTIVGAGGKAKVAKIPMKEVFEYLGKNWVTFLCHNVGFALLSFSSYGSSAWIPTFLVRNHGWTEAQAGQVYGWIVAIASTLGVYAGGRFADWMAERGHSAATMRVGFIVAIAWFPFGILYPLMPSALAAVLLIIPAAFLASAPFGVAPAAITQMMPNAMRGQASAIYLFVVNLIGLGIGPTAVAATTDFIFGDDQSVRYSLLIVASVAHIVSAVLLWAGIKPFLESIERLKIWTAVQDSTASSK